MTNFPQQGFNAGELSKRMLGQFGTDVYAVGCHTFVDGMVTKSGSARMRYGTEDLSGALDNSRTELIPFRLERFGEFMLELGVSTAGAGVVRLWDCRTGTILPTTLTHPYSLDQVFEVRHTQSNEALYLFHVEHPTQVVRQDAGTWTIRDIETQPSLTIEVKEIQLRAEAVFPALTPQFSISHHVFSGPAGAEEPLFAASDVGTFWVMGDNGLDEFLNPRNDGFGGWFEPEGLISREQVLSDYLDVAPQFSISTPKWTGPFVPQSVDTTTRIWKNQNFNAGDLIQIEARELDGTTVKPDYFTSAMMGSVINVTDEAPGAIEEVFLMWELRDAAGVVTDGPTAQRAACYVFRVEGGSGSGGGLAVAGNPTIYNPQDRGSENKVLQVTDVAGEVRIYCNQSIFDSSWVGVTIRLHDGEVQVQSVTGPNEIFGNVTRSLSAQTPTGTWSQGISSASGFPGCGGMHEDRLFVSRVPQKPNTIFGSRVGQHEDFFPGADDDAPVSFTVTSDLGDAAMWLKGANDLSEESRGSLLLGTNEREYKITGPITPTSIQVKPLTNHGSRDVQPISNHEGILMVERAGETIRDIRFYRDIRGFEDLTIYADHIFEDSPIRRFAAARNPESVVMALREDGQVRCLNLRRSSKVVAWSPWTLKGVQSIGSISSQGQDQVWFTVQRGGEYRVERWSPGVYLDDWYDRTDGPTSEVDNLDRYEGELVTVIDGSRIDGPHLVSGGSVLLDSPTGTNYRVGQAIGFELTPLIPEGADRGGSTSAGRQKNLSQIMVLMKDYVRGGKIGGEPFEEAQEEEGEWYRVTGLQEHSPIPRIAITNDAPLPFEVLAVTSDPEAGTS